MAMNAYLVVSDLHCCCKSFSGRMNYRDEMDHVQVQLIQTAKKYHESGYKVTLLLLGDVFHGAYKNVFTAVRDVSFFIMWKEAFGEIYSVFGNHEMNYYDQNPFHSLVAQIESEKLLASNARCITPIGMMSVIRVVDTLEDGEVCFHFNHYGVLPEYPINDGAVHIGLFHQEILNNEILRFAEDYAGQHIYTGEVGDSVLSRLGGYSYCFFGHMHKIYGTWETDGGTVLCYLASLGRTNVTEVSDSFLERNVPVVLIKNGKLCGVEDNKFLLLSRKECVDEIYVQASRETYEAVKAKQQVRSYVPMGDDPVANLSAAFAEHPQCLSMLNGLLKDDMDEDGCRLEAAVKKEVYG